MSSPAMFPHEHPGVSQRDVVIAVGRMLAVAAVMLTAYYVMPFDRSLDLRGGVVVVLGLAAILTISWLQIRSVLRSSMPGLRAAEAITVLVSLVLVVFASAYLAVSVRHAEAFSEELDHTGSLYFSLTTMTTVGFGDIAPRSNEARILVMVHMVANVVIIGVVVRFVLNAARRRRAESTGA